jgi:hypothetical protein
MRRAAYLPGMGHIKMRTKFWAEGHKPRDYSVAPGVDGRIILK